MAESENTRIEKIAQARFKIRHSDTSNMSEEERDKALDDERVNAALFEASYNAMMQPLEAEAEAIMELPYILPLNYPLPTEEEVVELGKLAENTLDPSQNSEETRSQ